MRRNKAGMFALGLLYRSVGWACFVYTLMQVMNGQLSGRNILAFILGGLVNALLLSAFDYWSIKEKPRSQEP